ncbi:uncharacterized protein LOC143428198 [Xylocopa sonorina]|uniref:uncharacterized protein LOC143428198 n=1 Tax=Xylocopa sonorina TaxID=1818115 RepID=UPI00403A7C7E
MTQSRKENSNAQSAYVDGKDLRKKEQFSKKWSQSLECARSVGKIAFHARNIYLTGYFISRVLRADCPPGLSCAYVCIYVCVSRRCSRSRPSVSARKCVCRTNYRVAKSNGSLLCLYAITKQEAFLRAVISLSCSLTVPCFSSNDFLPFREVSLSVAHSPLFLAFTHWICLVLFLFSFSKAISVFSQVSWCSSVPFALPSGASSLASPCCDQPSFFRPVLAALPVLLFSATYRSLSRSLLTLGWGTPASSTEGYPVDSTHLHLHLHHQPAAFVVMYAWKITHKRVQGSGNGGEPVDREILDRDWATRIERDESRTRKGERLSVTFTD